MREAKSGSGHPANTWNNYAPALRLSQIYLERTWNEQEWKRVYREA